MEDLLPSPIWTYLNSFGLLGIAIFINYTYKGLKMQIAGLEELKKTQKETLEAVKEKANASEELSKKYKTAFDDFKEMNDEINKRYKEKISELESSIKVKDEQLEKRNRKELIDIHKTQALLTDSFDEFLSSPFFDENTKIKGGIMVVKSIADNANKAVSTFKDYMVKIGEFDKISGLISSSEKTSKPSLGSNLLGGG